MKSWIVWRRKIVLLLVGFLVLGIYSFAKCAVNPISTTLEERAEASSVAPAPGIGNRIDSEAWVGEPRFPEGKTPFERLKNAIKGSGTATIILRVPPGRYVINSIDNHATLSIPSNITLKIERGAIFEVGTFTGQGVLSTIESSGNAAITSKATTVTLSAGSWPVGVEHSGYIKAYGEKKRIVKIQSPSVLIVDSAFSSDLTIPVPYTYSTRVVKGSGTAFTKQLSPASSIFINNKRYVVESIKNDTFITLATHPEDDQKNQKYSCSYCLKFNSNIIAGNYKLFTGDGSIIFAPSQGVNAVWFTSSGNGDGGSPYVGAHGGGGIGEALARTQDSVALELPTGLYSVTSTISISKKGTVIKGKTTNRQDSKWTKTQINFEAPADSVLFNFDTGSNSMLRNCSLSNVYLTSNKGHNHTAIKCVDVSYCEFRNIYIYNFETCGIDWRGRDLSLFERIHVQAQYPLRINKNPKINTIDLDNTVFRDMTLVGRSKDDSADNALVKIGDGVLMTHMIFEGVQSWQGGKYGLYWDDKVTTTPSSTVVLRNVKSEQAKPGNGYLFYISPNRKLVNLEISNCSDQSRRGGFAYLRNVNTGRIQQCVYGGHGGDYLNAQNCQFLTTCGFDLYGHSTASVPDMVEAFAIRGDDATEERNPLSVYLQADSLNAQRVTLFGTNVWTKKATLANNEYLKIPGFYGSIAQIFVTTSKGTGDCEGGHFVITKAHAPFTATKMSGTAHAYGSDSASDGLRVFRYPGAACNAVRNKLGETREVQVVVYWQ